MELAKRHLTIYFRAENLNVAEQEVGNKEQFCTTAGLAATRSRAWLQQVCQRAIPAQIACAECTQCARVAGERGGRRATDFNLLTNYALNVGTSSLREALQQLESSRACR